MIHLPCSICNIPITGRSKDEILELLRRASYTQLNTVNMEFIYWSQKDIAFRASLFAGINIADGKWIQLLCKFMGKHVHHIPGSRLIYDVLSVADTDRMSVLFYGSTTNTLVKLRRKISTMYPNLRGIYTNPGKVY